MKLLIVESPKKAQVIQKYLGSEFVVKSCYGHIRDLGKGGFKGIGIDINNNFRPYYEITKIKVLEELITEAEKCSEIFLFSDNDREGESISWHLKQMLESSGKKISRVSCQEITKKSIEQALKTTRDIDINLFKSQEARRILDRIVGFMVSPFLIETYGQNLSAGRVQSVAVRMIVDREQEIVGFKPEEYWNVFAKFAYNDRVVDTKLKNKISNKKQLDNIIGIINKNKEFIVKSVVGQNKKQYSPPPFTTISLQQYMSKVHGFSPERTMQAAQSLYETGYCTYIRTDSTRSSPEAISSVREWLTTNEFDIPKSYNEFTNKSSAQDAHECIHPTNVKDLPKDSKSLTKDESIVYRSIWTSFVASQMTPAIWNTLTIKISPRTDDKIIFVASGKALEYKGYLELIGTADTDKITLPMLKETEILTLSNSGLRTEQKFTQPSARYTDYSLLQELEKKSIGRPATYADIFKKITERNYIEKQGASYKPTELGKKIITSLVNKFPFMEYKYSANMEKQLDDIASGVLDQKEMLHGFFVPFQKRLNEAYMELGHSICGKCGSHMTQKLNKRDGSKFMACAAYPHCKNTQSIESR